MASEGGIDSPAYSAEDGLGADLGKVSERNRGPQNDARRKWLKFSEGLHPDPPDLKEVAGKLSPAQLFWVIKNCINMTGMPSFAQAGARDDEIWSITAFVKKLPSVSDADYKTWTASAEPKQ